MAKPINSQETIQTVSSLEELELLLASYKEANPVKFASKEANGEFEKLRVALGKSKKDKPEKK